MLGQLGEMLASFLVVADVRKAAHHRRPAAQHCGRRRHRLLPAIVCHRRCRPHTVEPGGVRLFADRLRGLIVRLVPETLLVLLQLFGAGRANSAHAAADAAARMPERTGPPQLMGCGCGGLVVHVVVDGITTAVPAGCVRHLQITVLLLLLVVDENVERWRARLRKVSGAWNELSSEGGSVGWGWGWYCVEIK